MFAAPQDESPQQAIDALLRDILHPARVVPLVVALRRTGVLDALDEPVSIDELATRTATDHEVLLRVVRFVAQAGVLRVDADGLVHHTARSRQLTGPGLGDTLEFDSDVIYGSLQRLDHSLRTGEASFPVRYGAPFYEWLTTNPDARGMWERALASRTDLIIRALLTATDWGRSRHVVDVGGGQGTLIAALLESERHLTATLFDLPSVVADAAAVLETFDVDGRVRVVAGDFFVEVPGGGDTYLLANVLWNWPDRAATDILAACRAAANDRDRLIVFETFVPPPGEWSAAWLLDVTNVAQFGGRGRTVEEHRRLLEASGWKLVGHRPSSGLGWGSIEAAAGGLS